MPERQCGICRRGCSPAHALHGGEAGVGCLDGGEEKPRLDWSGDSARSGPDQGQPESRAVQREVLDGEEEAGRREARNGEASAQTRAPKRSPVAGCRGPGVGRLASCDRRRQKISKSGDQVREEAAGRRSGGHDQGRPAQASATARTGGRGPPLRHASDGRASTALCGSAVANLCRSWTSKKIKVPSSKASGDDLGQDLGLHDLQQLCTACRRHQRLHTGLDSLPRNAHGVLGPSGGALVAV